MINLTYNFLWDKNLSTLTLSIARRLWSHVFEDHLENLHNFCTSFHLETVRRLCAGAASWFLTDFQVFGRGRKSLSNRPVSVGEHRWNLVKGVLDQLWAILVVYLCIFFKVIVKLDVDAGGSWGGVRSGSRRKLLLPRSQFVSKGRKKKTKKQCDEDHKRISVARDVHESWKKIKCMCVYSSDTAFAQYLLSLELRRRARFPSVLQEHPWRTLPASVKQVLEQSQETFGYANCKETSTNY